MVKPISITAINSISPLGISLEETWENYKHTNHFIRYKDFNGGKQPIASLSNNAKAEIKELKKSNSKYKKLDNSVLYAIYASRLAMKTAGWKSSDNFGINIGSSRGATTLFEKYHKDFLAHGGTDTLSSPTTTLGNISSWVAHDLQTQGPEISHSITCSTALHALLNGIAWISSGMCNKFLVGGSEAPLTDFTIAQMHALKIYAKDNNDYPCQSLNLNKNRNSMVLGEGASTTCLEEGIKHNALAIIEGIGYATEILEHSISISTEAECFQRSMKMALGSAKPSEIDAIVMHAPGTVKGDRSEFKAIEKVFGNDTPAITSNKWKLGHTFGASGMLSMELAILMFRYQQFIPVPFIENRKAPKQLKKILVNAVGFGGNAVSILLAKK
ncbi:beta-ketoacyl synthase N-terminal-like domain-containing protein [Aureibaculum sp. 2210JD6-5]|uniref:beta-ketoacyl synthase N-terminal-like domain-containing protein n=1 Tax=Aureibaculum sp. 2210JD6-5 TaxID=3103957 RepID=UPI002AAC9D55|nr:beta-ketoacyl synthase N-terminal-like domain-containing protein [Aureibaculum sp. 2210JD6-5]MDY7395458.1 beta-ketoacyl synthase N-terminal-like domain-containing protein [Aureibaculum sp. 2210JD6-5]